MDEQLALFDAPAYPVAAPPRPARRGTPRYRRLRLGDTRIPCDDCVLLLRLDDWRGPVPLPASWVRHDSDGSLWLCHGHTRNWMEADPT